MARSRPDRQLQQTASCTLRADMPEGPALEIRHVNRLFALTPTGAAALLLALSLTGCGSVENFLAGDKVDYRTRADKTAPLDVPPDLSQLARDSRYQPQSGVVSASQMQRQGGAAATAPASPSAGPAAAATPPAGAPVAAPVALGDLRVERQGNTRWLVTAMPPEQLWPQLRAFWLERGFKLTEDDAQVGVLETEWAENRAKLPNDIIRNTLGRVLDSLYSTGERDRFRTRVERSASGGSEVFISHRGVAEVYTDERRERTVWQPRPSDPQLEAEMLTRLMVKLGAKDEVARTAVAEAPSPVARARNLADQPGAALEIDEGFDRAWRRVGLALDRGGFTVEDRDRAAGLYFVRYVDAKQAAKDEPGFFGKLFGSSKSGGSAPLQRFRVAVKAAGDKTRVTVQNNQGGADNGDAARLIAARLVDELK